MGEEEKIKLILEKGRRKEILNKFNLLAGKHGVENILEVMRWAYGENLIIPKSVTGLSSVSFPVLTERGIKWIEKSKNREL